MFIKAKNKKTFEHATKGIVLAHLSAHAQDQDLSFQNVRKSLSLSKTDLPDGVIHQIAIDAGFEVV